MSSSGLSVAKTGLHDTLRNFERLEFSDLKLAFDLHGNAGKAALLLGAVLGRDIMMAKKELLGTDIGFFDQGFTLGELSGALMRLNIWDILAGGNSADQIATYLLKTVHGVAPDSSAIASAVASINSNAGEFLAHLAESAANQAQIHLVGLVQNGLEFA